MTAILPDGLSTALRARFARQAPRVVVFSGAGMSADSGIPTFRSGDNGLWKAFDPQALATPEAWRQDRHTVWGWYEWRRGLVAAAQPHPGHVAVARMQQALGATIVTQNVDDLHERAGATDVLHLHGSLFAARCSLCGRPHELGPACAEPHRRLSPPRCEHCGGDVRPGVVWFGESLPYRTVMDADAAIARCELLLIVGTSGVVYPAAGMVRQAPEDALVVEINPEPGAVAGRVDVRWQTTAALGLPAIAQALGIAAD